MQFRVGSTSSGQPATPQVTRPCAPTSTLPFHPATHVTDTPHRYAVPPAVLEARQKGPAQEKLPVQAEDQPREVLDARPLDEPGTAGNASLDAELTGLAVVQDARRFGDRVYERARQILEESYESAAELRLEALSRVREQMAASEKSSADLRARANDEAQAIRAQAATEAQLALQRAQREADAIVANARATAQRIAEGAQAEADGIQRRAQHEGQEVHDSAAHALAEARSRLEEIERLETEFESTAREFARWLGLTVEPDRNLFAGIRRKK